MSEHNLAISNQYELNAKHPSAVDTVDGTVLNMAIGGRYPMTLTDTTL